MGPGELLSKGGVEEDAGLMELGAKRAADLATFPSGEVRELGEPKGVEGDVTAL